MTTAEAPPTPATPTERMVASMLVENTGAAMMDSGMYGRAWQTTRAQFGLDGGLPNSAFHGGPGHDPAEPRGDEIERVALAMSEGPEGRIDAYGTAYVDTFHWLVERLEYDEALDRKYQRFTRVTNFGKDRWDKDWGIPVAERFLELLAKQGASGGIYPGESTLEYPGWTNTYNGECELDRTLQFVLFHSEESDAFLPEGSYVLLQVHGGADVRGGYTDPRLFKVLGEQADLFDFSRLEVWCEGAEVLPNGAVDGQVTMDAEVIAPFTTSHRWDNSYDGNHVRLTYSNGDWLDYVSPDKEEQILATSTREEDIAFFREKGVQIGYGTPERFAKANIATYDEEAKIWRCPFDGSELHVSGALVG